MGAEVCASKQASGVPDFGAGILRERLIRQLEGAGTRPSVIVGPSGSGKSFLAAQFALGFNGVVAWVDACGADMQIAEIADSATQALGVTGDEVPTATGYGQESDSIARVVDAVRMTAEGRPVCIVIDDLRNSDEHEGIASVTRAARSLWRVGARILVTARSISTWPADVRWWPPCASDPARAARARH